MALGDLPQALSLGAFTLDGGIVQLQWIATDVPAFEASAPHPGKDRVAVIKSTTSPGNSESPASLQE